MPIDYIGTAYSATLILGGIMGYVKTGSAISMAAGISTGTLAGVGAYQMSMDHKNAGLSLCVSTFMTALMGYRFAMTRKIMPAGVIAAASTLVSLRNGMNLYMKT
ncbi:14C [Octopus vulgaris]|uniref:14C n=2 Tax=Octopus TaxID=6643 RepID=A0AA36BLT0_OCTVU|nr:transmembrane protein 14C [Octopus sinensis]CAI9736623.1 14C [Octopus vulgaris]